RLAPLLYTFHVTPQVVFCKNRPPRVNLSRIFRFLGLFSPCGEHKSSSPLRSELSLLRRKRLGCPHSPTTAGRYSPTPRRSLSEFLPAGYTRLLPHSIS